MSAPRLLRIRCSTWDQVESFYTRKLRKNGRMAMRVPFVAELGTPVTLALELPSQIVIAIDGTIAVVGEGGGRVEVSLYGMTPALQAQLEAMVSAARDSDARDEAVDDEERRLLAAREGDLRRMRQLGAHELLGVPRDPSALELRAAWNAIARREHPDAVARYASPALSAAAEDAMALVGRAYDRLRADVVASGHGAAMGATIRPVGWKLDQGALADASGFFAEAVTPPLDTAAIDVALEPSMQLPAVEPAPPSPAPAPDLEAALPPEPPPFRPRAIAASEPAPLGPPPEPPPYRPREPSGEHAVELPPVDTSRPSTDELALPPIATPPPPAATVAVAPAAVAVRFGAHDLFHDLEPPAAPLGATPLTVDEALAQARSGPGDRFLRQIRERLAAGDHGAAQQIAEAALHLYGGDRRLRGLQHVAIAMAACGRNDRLAAVAALETALSHDPGSAEAAQALETVRRAITPTVLAMQRLFR